MVKLSIDGKAVEVPENTTILQAARLLDIPVPTLCSHPKLTPFGGCRICIVEVKDVPKPVTSCNTYVREGMEVSTSTPEIEDLRKLILELILSDHPNDCMVCEQAGNCTLQELAYAYGIRENEFAGERRVYGKRDGNHFIERDLEKCILCGRCVKVCDEVQGVEAIDFGYRGFRSKICTSYEDDLDCEFCGQCITVCPTGALTGKQWGGKGRPGELREVDTVCPYCGTGCNITVQVKRNEISRVMSKENTWNEGWLCVKGRFGYKFVNSPDRLRKPLIRIAPKSEVRNQQNAEFRIQNAEAGGQKSAENSSHITPYSSLFREASWDEALDYVASRLGEIKSRYGADAIAGLSSARCTTEENYVFQKFMRAAVGTNNVDHCARL
jgi:predicted molibdopterin-dependent oxidoreductase YjgC